MFKCKVCAEKDARISDLKSQISHLKALVTPPTNSDPTVDQLEADGIMNGQQYILEIPTAQDRAASTADVEQAERDRIFAGTY
jgi:hypothetical protein